MSAPGIRLIVGLGNPGAEYAQTRHNAGAWLIHLLSEQKGAALSFNKKLFGDATNISIANTPVHLFVPATYMNESGKAVLAIAYFYKIPPQQILVVHDEIDYPAGKIKLKNGGGHGGHNGLRDIASRLQSKDFWRLRVGIAHPGHKDGVSNHVLSKPSAEDKFKIDQSIDQAMSILEPLILGQYEKACLTLHSEE